MRERKGNGRTISWGERLPNSRGHGVTLFQNALRCSCRSYSSIGSRDLLVLLPCPPCHRGRGIASLFFLELRRSTVGLPSPLLGERTRSERVSRKKGDSREYSGSLKRRTANQSSSTKESRGERRKKSINNHHHHRRSPRIFPSFVQPTTRTPPPRFYGVFEGQSRRESSRQRKKRR